MMIVFFVVEGEATFGVDSVQPFLGSDTARQFTIFATAALPSIINLMCFKVTGLE